MTRVLLLLLTVLLPGVSLANTEQEWRFRVFLEDSEIGTHTFRVDDNSGDRRVESDARFTVRFLFIEAYNYEHRARERWRGNCLDTVESSTNDNGERLAVSGIRSTSGFAVKANSGQAALPSCVMTFAYWNPAMLKQARLLNVQTGELLDVRVEPLGEEVLNIRGQRSTAHRYALHAPKFRVDVWYADGQQWVQLESRTEGGRLLRYLIQ
ncbi:MAG: DUF6134 family protein [Gammaproteobacteria bacterium]|nr:DUF6134 family protein [Gammaproteobacteria bacterium]